MRIAPPKRIRHTYTQTLQALPDDVFPFFCPVLEEEWGCWDPNLVISSTGMAEEACIFITHSSPHDAIWVVTHLDQDNHFVEILKITPDHSVGKLCIQLDRGEGNQTLATVACTCTAMGDEGEAFVDRFTRESYEAMMQQWEASLNHYLATGEKRPPCAVPCTDAV